MVKRMTIPRVSQITLLVLAPTIMAHAQVASKDLLRLPAAFTARTPAETEQKMDQANGCPNKSGFRDGVTLDPDKKPRKLKVELVKISSKKLPMDSEIIATAKLQNIGRKSIRIPWNTDFQTTKDGQIPEDRSWEFAEFRVSIRDRENSEYFDQLVTTSQPLYGSEFVAGSYLTLRPGEWITARISFRVALRRPQFEKLSTGTADLAMEWFQTARTHVEKDCGVTFGYFPYDNPFKSLNRRVVAKVQIEAADAATKATQ